ncbi:TPA: hypothetical protein N8030_002967 [Escherichia coli]|uniref:hypothetical protein n=1 Tax=Escherichia TaxID=561 RepID=UPI00117B8ECD|nr:MULTISPECIES: hypothetical protein [Escherichia]EFN4050392.1 hypothetical protein [Escherichia coli]EHB5925321.1 hypothetical protein [Escherichia coli]EHU9037502.1 hypothetical protein [Escherichia coli]EHU9092971.1 hypothetical protein [Escherichia coli]EHU9097388.1 hypothetical protein [Escherichia coli]
MEDLYTMPFSLFIYLFVYDTFVEPNSSRIDQVRHTEILQAIWLSTGNIKKEDLKKFSITELDSLNIINNKTIKEQAEEREKRIAEEQRANMLNWMGRK